MPQTSSPKMTESASALAALFPNYSQRARRYARSLVRNESDSEEIVQEAFCRLARKESLEKYEPEHLHTVLFATVRNLAIDTLRKKSRQRNVSLATLTEPIDRSPDESELDQLQSDLQELMSQLPSGWGDALKLRSIGELSYDEISHVLGCTSAQVRTWIYRGRKRLAQELAKKGWMKQVF